MEQDRTEELLNKFYEGKTSEEEEAQLKEYLSDPAISPSLRAKHGYHPGMAPAIPEPSDAFYERLEAVTRLKTTMNQRQRVIRYIMGTAAAAAILAGAYFIFGNTGTRGMRDTYQDPRIAMAEVRNILMTVSEKMTEGTAPLGSINSMNIAPEALSGLGKINSVVEDNLSRLRYLDQLGGPLNKTDNN